MHTNNIYTKQCKKSLHHTKHIKIEKLSIAVIDSIDKTPLFDPNPSTFTHKIYLFSL